MEKDQASPAFSNFVVGDVIQLKSGGPKMTVSCVRTYSESQRVHSVDTMWFDEEDRLQRDQFLVGCLAKVVD